MPNPGTRRTARVSRRSDILTRMHTAARTTTTTPRTATLTDTGITTNTLPVAGCRLRSC